MLKMLLNKRASSLNTVQCFSQRFRNNRKGSQENKSKEVRSVKWSESAEEGECKKAKCQMKKRKKGERLDSGKGQWPTMFRLRQIKLS